jgi:hypothetical protein
VATPEAKGKKLPKRVFLLNDTDHSGQHFGCQRVMRIIKSNLATRNAVITGSVKSGIDWRQKKRNYSDISKSDLLLVNGEGTLHHGKGKGEWLLEAATYAKKAGVTTALINAIWQDNPKSWDERVKSFDHIYCRDSRSAKALSLATERRVEWMGDLTMTTGTLEEEKNRTTRIIFGDSVSTKVSRSLVAKACTLGEDVIILPLTSQGAHNTTMRGRVGHQFLDTIRAMRGKNDEKWQSKTHYAEDDEDFILHLLSAQLVVTGRFHAVCLAIATRTPFIAISSNSWKTETLVADIGLSNKRIISIKELDELDLNKSDFKYSPAELLNMEKHLSEWRIGSERMFDTIIGDRIS